MLHLARLGLVLERPATQSTAPGESLIARLAEPAFCLPTFVRAKDDFEPTGEVAHHAAAFVRGLLFEADRTPPNGPFRTLARQEVMSTRQAIRLQIRKYPKFVLHCLPLSTPAVPRFDYRDGHVGGGVTGLRAG